MLSLVSLSPRIFKNNKVNDSEMTDMTIICGEAIQTYFEAHCMEADFRELAREFNDFGR